MRGIRVLISQLFLCALSPPHKLAPQPSTSTLGPSSPDSFADWHSCGIRNGSYLMPYEYTICMLLPPSLQASAGVASD